MASPTQDQVFAELTARLSPETEVRRDEALARRTTFRVGGKADWFVEPASEADLAQVVRFCREKGLATFVLGRGSNLLVRDGGIRGVVISLGHPNFCRIEIDGQTLRCGAGAKLKALAQEACKYGLKGLEFMEGIPGSVGGALRMNAGAMGSATFDRVESLRTMDPAGSLIERSRPEIQVQYRCCLPLKTELAVGVVFRGEPGPIPEIAERMKAFSQKRWAGQPKEPSAGCIFKNPAAIAAGRLIDQLGLKGTKMGGAAVSTVHGNFIVNTGQATARDVLSLIELIKERARADRGIALETEVEVVGEE